MDHLMERDEGLFVVAHIGWVGFAGRQSRSHTSCYYHPR